MIRQKLTSAMPRSFLPTNERAPTNSNCFSMNATCSGRSVKVVATLPRHCQPHETSLWDQTARRSRLCRSFLMASTRSCTHLYAALSLFW